MFTLSSRQNTTKSVVILHRVVFAFLSMKYKILCNVALALIDCRQKLKGFSWRVSLNVYQAVLRDMVNNAAVVTFTLIIHKLEKCRKILMKFIFHECRSHEGNIYMYIFHFTSDIKAIFNRQHLTFLFIIYDISYNHFSKEKQISLVTS